MVTGAEAAVIGVEDGLSHASDRCEAIFTPSITAHALGFRFTRRRAQVDGMVFADCGRLHRFPAPGGDNNVIDEALADVGGVGSLRGAHNFWRMQPLRLLRAA
ncbi:MAG: hypothetical protein R3D67_20540 [Hyphomicrobiaceae bacterium]